MMMYMMFIIWLSMFARNTKDKVQLRLVGMSDQSPCGEYKALHATSVYLISVETWDGTICNFIADSGKKQTQKTG